MVSIRACFARFCDQVADRRKKRRSDTESHPLDLDFPPKTIGILSLEVAKIMSRIVYLHRSLSDDEISRLRFETMRSQGVASLVSGEESFLLSLACGEKLEDLGRIADAIARLERRCKQPGLRGFQHVYADLTRDGTGIGELGFPVVEIDDRVRGMERYVSLTADLFFEMDTLKEMESSERKMKQWRSAGSPTSNMDVFRQKLDWQRQRVCHLRQISLWNQTYDKAVWFMARMVCTVYARICFVFGQHVLGLPQVSAILIVPVVSDASSCSPTPGSIEFPSSKDRILWSPETGRLECDSEAVERILSPKNAATSTCPAPVLQHIGSSEALNRSDLEAFYARKLFLSSTVKSFKQGNRSSKIHDAGDDVGLEESHKNSRVFDWQGGVVWQKNRLMSPLPSTVGGSALAQRYSNVILLVQKFIQFPNMVNEDARNDLYQLLPTSLRMKIKAKHRKFGKKNGLPAGNDEQDVNSYREKLEEILSWLAPMAHDMVRWQSERNFEQQEFVSRTNVLLLQTLHFADREKTEEVLAELLVGLSFICLCEKRCMSRKNLSVHIER